MAKDDELELDTKVVEKGGKAKLIMIMVGVMLLTTGILVGVLYLTGVLGGKTDSSHTKKDEHAEEEKKELVIKEAFYVNMQPAFIVNFEEQSEAAYLQVEMQAMTYDQRVTDHMNKHKPVIRNNILLILSAQKFDEVKTREGKVRLQEKVLLAVQEIVGESMEEMYKDEELELAKGESVPNVEQIYFTSFIMQ